MELLALHTLMPRLTAMLKSPMQPHRLAFIGEKPSLSTVLRPLVREVEARYYCHPAILA